MYPMKTTYTQTDKRNVAQTVADELAAQAGEGWTGKVCWNADVAGIWEITLLRWDAATYSQECRIAWLDLGF